MSTGPITQALQISSGTKVIDWNDFMNVVEAADTPIMAMIKKGNPLSSPDSNWAGIKRSVGPITPVPDNTPITDANYQPRVTLKAVAQQIREPWKVSEWARKTKTHAVKDEVEFQKSEALVRQRLKIERCFAGIQDCALQGSGTPAAEANQLRSIGRWLKPLASDLNAEYPIPTGFRVAAACWYAGTLANLKASDVQAIVLAASKQRKVDVTLDLHAGPNLVAQMADFTEHDMNATANNFPLTQYQIPKRDNAYLKRVEFFTFPNGKIRLHENWNLFYDLATGLPTYQTENGGYLLDMTNGWAVREMEPITHEDLSKDGSGVRGFYSWKGMLACYRPAGQGVIAPETPVGWTYAE